MGASAGIFCLATTLMTAASVTASIAVLRRAGLRVIAGLLWAACRATPGAAWRPPGQALYHARGADCALSPARACYPHLPGNGTLPTMHSARTTWTDAPVAARAAPCALARCAPAWPPVPCAALRYAALHFAARRGAAAGCIFRGASACTLLLLQVHSSAVPSRLACNCTRRAGVISCFGCMRSTGLSVVTVLGLHRSLLAVSLISLLLRPALRRHGI